MVGNSSNLVKYFLPDFHRIFVLNDVSCFTNFYIFRSDSSKCSFLSVFVLKYNFFIVNSNIFFFFLDLLVSSRYYNFYNMSFFGNLNKKLTMLKHQILFFPKLICSNRLMYSAIFLVYLYNIKYLCTDISLTSFSRYICSVKSLYKAGGLVDYLNKYKRFFKRYVSKMKLKNYLKRLSSINLQTKEKKHLFYDRLIKRLEKRNPMFNSFYNNDMFKGFFSIYKRNLKILFTQIFKKFYKKKMKNHVFYKKYRKFKFNGALKMKKSLNSYCSYLKSNYIDNKKTFSNYFSYFQKQVFKKHISSSIKLKASDLLSYSVNTEKVSTSFLVYLIRVLNSKKKKNLKISKKLSKITTFYNVLKIMRFRNQFFSYLKKPVLKHCFDKKNITYVKKVKSYNSLVHMMYHNTSFGYLYNVFLCSVFFLKNYILLPIINNNFTFYKNNILFFGCNNLFFYKKRTLHTEIHISDLFNMKLKDIF